MQIVQGWGCVTGRITDMTVTIIPTQLSRTMNNEHGQKTSEPEPSVILTSRVSQPRESESRFCKTLDSFKVPASNSQVTF